MNRRGPGVAPLAFGALAVLLAGCAPTDGVSTGVPEPATEGAEDVAETVASTELCFEVVRRTPRFRHATGGFGQKRLPETMGAGAVLLDYDGDDVLDLFLVNGTAWTDDPGGPDAARGRCALWRGLGDGRFEDVSADTGADVEVYGMGATAADYDADGDDDLYVTTLGHDLLLRNDGGRFVDVAAAAGVGQATWTDAEGREHPEWTTACLWLDADRDGWLDLFVGGYCEWTPALEIFTSLDGLTKAFTTPERYRGLPCRLYRNRGDGTFEERSLGPRDAITGKALGATVWDLDEDGWPEILVANDTRPDFLFQALGDGRYEERGAAAGIAYDETGRARAGMGIDVAVDERGVMIAIGNFSDEPLSLHRADGPDRFRADAERAGLAAATRRPLTFGLVFADLDLDGRQDLLLANGHIEPTVADARPGSSHAQSPQCFLGSTGGRFVDVSEQLGRAFTTPRVGRGLVPGDLDGDGDVDLVLTQNGAEPVVLLNRLQEQGERPHLTVRLAGRKGNLRAIGARVRVVVRAPDGSERTLEQTVRTGGSYLGHGAPELTFGLGATAGVARIEVTWPTGGTTLLEEPALPPDSRLTLVEPG